MSSAEEPSLLSRPAFAIALGIVIGGLLLFLASLQPVRRLGDEIAIRVNGVDPRMARDVLLPGYGWTLQVLLPVNAETGKTELPENLIVELREERTGLTLEIQDRLLLRDGYASYTVPKDLGLHEGLIAIRLLLADEEGNPDGRAEDWVRVRLRPWTNGPPVGSRQWVFFDFGVDQNENGRIDFHEDLERLGFAAGAATTAALADAIADRALRRVLRAYNPEHDPNRTGQDRDIVRVRFEIDPSTIPKPSPYTTRICVGGVDPSHPESVGQVGFDRDNKKKSSTECGLEPPAGIFPSALATYRDSALYKQILAPFNAASGGVPIGNHAEDAAALAQIASAGVDEAPGSRNPATGGQSERERALSNAISVLGDALGSIMAHETGHALGLVAEGAPGVGLFGGSSQNDFAHNLAADGSEPAQPWLMNPGRSLSFEALAGRDESGELHFRPLNYAYLRDRIVLIEGRMKRIKKEQI
ncbi:MAG: hypothetical protein AB8G23_11585 [Myxococcota bacterium]